MIRRPFVAADLAALVALAIFAVDLLTELHGAIAVLYIVVPLLLAPAVSERIVIGASAGCALLATAAFLSQHFGEDFDSAYTRFAVSLAALAVTTVLALRQKRSAAASERSERRYRAIFQAACFATWESDWSEVRRFVVQTLAGVQADPETWLLDHPEAVREAARRAVIREVNAATMSLFGVADARDLVGGNYLSRYTSGSERGFASILASLLAGNATAEAEVPLLTPDGRRLERVLRVALVAEGEPWSRALVMAFDETERKEARAKLDQASAELAHASRVSVLGQLSASVAHEVNQPLTAIVTFGESATRWLGRDTPDLGEAGRCLDQIIANAGRAAEVIARIRSLARNAPPKVGPIALADLIEETVDLVAGEAGSGCVRMRMQLAPTPEVAGDRVQIQQVLMNLLLNGLQAMRDANPLERDIVVSLAGGDGMARVEVSDRGTGIADPSAIFAPFFTTKPDGMGMGLAICQSIIEAQGGRITARNNEDGGATIAFTLPLHRPEIVAIASVTPA